MKITPKRVFGALSLLALAAAVVFFSLNSIARKRRVEVQQELRQLLGEGATFESVDVGLWDGFAFTVKQFRIADDALFAATPLVQARELRLGMSVWHLLLGRLVITSLSFTEPELQIITSEEGLLNVNTLLRQKKELMAFPRLRAGGGDKRSAAVSFLITRLQVVDGRIDFIDRSINAPAELQVKRIDLDVGGLDLSARAKIKLTGSLAPGVGKDVRIEGEIGPPALGQDWAQQPVNLEMQFDSLYLPMLARAIPFFRDRVPGELDITGPMYFHTRLRGTLQQPRFTDLTLKVPLLGSSDYNAVLEGRAELTGNRDWGEAPITGKLSLMGVNLSQLRKLPFMRQIMSEDFATTGSLNVQSRFVGTWNRLRLGVFLDADQSALHYSGRFQKPPDQPAQLRAQISKNHGRYVLHPSELRVGDVKVDVSGALTDDEKPRLSVRLKSGQNSVQAIEPFLAGLAYDISGGNVDWDLLLERDLGASGTVWETRGVVNLNQLVLRHRTTATKIDRLRGSLSFSGRRARASYLTFRVGSTPVSMSLDITEISPLRARYSLQSDNLNLIDFPLFGGRAGSMKNLVSSGELSFAGGARRLTGVVRSSEGTLQGTSYLGLQTDIAWTPEAVSFKDLRMEAFNGELRMGGSWNDSAEQARHIWLMPSLEAVSLKGILRQLAPQLKDRFDGKLDFSGEFDASAVADGTLREAWKGSGAVLIREGTIKDFNLIARLFYRGAQQARDGASQDVGRNLPAAVEREDTPVQELRTTVAVERQRIRTEDLSFLTQEYSINGAGWIGLDGTIQWNGILAFSPLITRELQREYSAIRYFVDRKGRLAIAFRLEGKLPNIRVRPESRALAQAMRWGGLEEVEVFRGRQGAGGKTWLPESLDRLLHR